MEADASLPLVTTTMDPTTTTASTSSNKKSKAGRTGSATGVDVNNSTTNTHRKNYSSSRYNNNNGSNMQRYQTNGGMGYGGNNGGYAYGQQMVYEMDPQMRDYYAHMAVQQIEVLYSIDCLCVDTFFRSYMDETGFSPLALVASYPNVAYYGASIYDLMDKISSKEDSPLEVDRENETIRLKEGWEKVRTKRVSVAFSLASAHRRFVFVASFR